MKSSFRISDEKSPDRLSERKRIKRQIAVRFAVSLIFVFHLIKNFRQNVHIAQKPHGGGNTPAIIEKNRI